MKIMVGISGGVDSAVSAYLLKQQGYEVIAGFMKNYATEQPGCTTKEDRDMAIKVAQFLGIKTFVIFDFREEYQKRVLDYLYEGYKKGITPNPDVLCNSEIKFKLFMEYAKDLGCEKIATGHYARIREKDGFYSLLRGVDTTKDQSYFLAGLNQEQLASALFPIGELEKSEVRKIAKEIGLPNADRKDSQGLCFVGNVPMSDFLKNKLPEVEGNIVDIHGTILGKHMGAWFYTIGQRHGIGLHKQYYVLGTNVDKNEIVVGEKEAEELFSDTVKFSHIHRIGKEYEFPLECSAKIRYRQEPIKGVVDSSPLVPPSLKGALVFRSEEMQRAIAPGQVIALYVGDELVASGVIC